MLGMQHSWIMLIVFPLLLLLLQVTKLCDLAPDDQVCSVSWSQRGTYLSVGTNSGEVQVRWHLAAARDTTGRHTSLSIDQLQCFAWGQGQQIACLYY